MVPDRAYGCRVVMGALYVPAGQPPSERDEENEDKEQPESPEDIKTEVEDPVHEHGHGKAKENDPRPFLFRTEPRGPQTKAPDAGEYHVTRDRGDRPYDTDRKAALKNVQDILYRRKPEAGCGGIDDPVHRLVKLGVAVYGEKDNKELYGLLDHRRDERGPEDALRKQQFDDCCGDDRERPKKKDPCDKMQGFGLIAVLPVDIQEKEEGGGNGNEKETQHHRSIGNRNRRVFPADRSFSDCRFCLVPGTEPAENRYANQKY